MSEESKLGGWERYERHVLETFERQDRALKEINEKLERLWITDMSQIKIDIAQLQVKAGLWGGGIGALAGAVTSMGALLLRHGG